MRKSYSVAELKKASDHLFYEKWMLDQLVSLLDETKTDAMLSKPDSYTHSPIATISRLNSTGILRVSNYDSNITNPKEMLIVSRVINNAIVEAFAIHTRSLLDFFYGKENNDDVIAEHFFSPVTIWINQRPPKTSNELNKIKIRVNKEIAHLTYYRQSVQSKTWPYKSIQRDLNKAFTVFSTLVPKNLLGKRWQ